MREARRPTASLFYACDEKAFGQHRSGCYVSNSRALATFRRSTHPFIRCGGRRDVQASDRQRCRWSLVSTAHIATGYTDESRFREHAVRPRLRHRFRPDRLHQICRGVWCDRPDDQHARRCRAGGPSRRCDCAPSVRRRSLRAKSQLSTGAAAALSKARTKVTQ